MSSLFSLQLKDPSVSSVTSASRVIDVGVTLITLNFLPSAKGISIIPVSLTILMKLPGSSPAVLLVSIVVRPSQTDEDRIGPRMYVEETLSRL